MCFVLSLSPLPSPLLLFCSPLLPPPFLRPSKNNNILALQLPPYYPPWQPLQTSLTYPNNPFNVCLHFEILPACDPNLRFLPQGVRCPLRLTPYFGSKLVLPSLAASLSIPLQLGLVH